MNTIKSNMNQIKVQRVSEDGLSKSENQYNGNLRKSIETNGERFNFPNVLIKIFENTMEVIE